MTTEEELALIRKNRAPSQALQDGLQGLSDAYRAATTPATPAEATPAPAPEAPAPVPAAKTPDQIDSELGLPPRATGLAALPAEDAGFWDVASAAWRAETIKTDAWNDKEVRRRALLDDMLNALPKAVQDQIKKQFTSRRGVTSWAAHEKALVAAIRDQAAASADDAARLARYPQSDDDFAKRIDDGRLADLDEAQAVLDQPGGAVAEFLGSATRAMTDQTSLMLLPLGVTGSVWRRIAGEVALGALGEAVVLPREYRVAEELGLPDPDPASRIAMGATFGGVFALGIEGLSRGLTALQARTEARRASLAETLPPGTDRIDHEAQLEAAEAELRGDQTVQERLNAGSETPGSSIKIDFAMGPNRPDAPNQPVLDVIAAAVEDTLGRGARVVIVSGQEGIDPKTGRPRPQYGSNRHGTGDAADIAIFDADGNPVTMLNNPDMMREIARAASRRGARGIGLGTDYMGGVHMHIDLVEPGPGQANAWGSEGKAMRDELARLQGATPSGAAPALPPVGPDAPPDWARIRNGIFAGESGADFNALFGYQNRKGGKFSHIKPSEMTVDQWLAFQDPNGEYGQWVKANRPDPENGVATPMGAYQIVGSTLRELKRDLGLKGDEVMTPEFQDYLAQQIYLRQGTGAWQGYKGPRDSYTAGSVDGPAPDFGPTTRGYTGQGQVAVGDNTRIDVDYEVVDYRSLIRASGDLQPRDRTRINSDEWVASTAARLDPAQLMPAPTADRGTPIVGPDNVIESGNGRTMAIARAYERHPDRAEAYRGAIEAAGYQIPDGVEQPVLIARRRTDLSPDQRRQMVIDAQDSGVAQMTPTEVARATARNLGAPILSRLDPTQPLGAEANGAFVRAALATLPRSARNAMFDPGGALNALGQRQLKEAIFARAWPDPDILARYTEGAPAELKSLMEALETAAPNWAALKADIEAGLVTPDMDISGFVLDAMRLIGAARELAARQGMPIAKAVAELVDEIDLIEGAISPLTAALVRKMWKGGRAAPADEVASFLARYADEARTAGKAGGMFDTPGPRDVLRTIDPATFGDLPEDLGQARGFATRPTSEAPPEAVAQLPDQGFDQGARSPEAEAVHAEIEADLRATDGAFGPILEGYEGKPQEAIARLLAEKKGEARAVLTHPDVAEPIDLVYGEAPAPGREGFGIAKIAAKHPEVLDDLQGFLSRLKKDDANSGPNRTRLTDANGMAVVRLDYDGRSKTWLMTAYEKRAGSDATTDTAPSKAPDDTAGQGTGTTGNIGQTSGLDKPAALAARADASGDEALAQLAAARADLGEFADIEIDLPDGTTARAGDILDDLDMDRAADAVVQACATSSNGAPA